MAIENLVKMQVTSVPEQRKMRYTNWHAVLILADLRAWYEKHEDKRKAFGSFNLIVNTIENEMKKVEATQTKWWHEAFEELSFIGEVSKDAMLATKMDGDNNLQALKCLEVLILYKKLKLNLVLRQISDQELQLV